MEFPNILFIIICYYYINKKAKHVFYESNK